MIEPIKKHLIQNVKREVVKHNVTAATEKDKYRKIQNETENKGLNLDEFAQCR